MRLIDGDALIKAIVRKEPFSDCARVVIAECMEEVRHAPTIEPERKKGKWVPEFDGKFTGGAYWFSCSKCKRIVPEVRNGGWNFCPNCGADMRGKGERDG